MYWHRAGRRLKCGSTCSSPFPSGTSVTLTAAADTGSTFTGWNGCYSTDGSKCTVTIKVATTVTATFSNPDAKYDLAVTKAGTGSVTVSTGFLSWSGKTGTAIYNAGTSVTLTAKVTTGSFSGWSGDCTGTGLTCTVAMSATRNVTASFKARAVSLPQTGQTKSYYAGDDGALKRGVTWPNPRFTDNGDQTVTDNLTGLVWAKDASVPTVGSCKGKSKTWQAALDYVACLNKATYRNYSDWRLPNIKELWSIVDNGKNIPSLPSGHPFDNVQSDDYWSSTTYAHSTSNAVIVNMAVGTVNPLDKSYYYYVWPVRSGQVGKLADLADLADLTISKSGTGSGSVTSADGKLGCGSSCTAAYTPSSATSVTLTAKADSDSTFTGWSGDCTGTDSTCTVSMSASRNVAATFDLPCSSYTINPQSKTFPSKGGTDSLNVSANSGCKWTASSDGMGNDNRRFRFRLRQWQHQVFGSVQHDHKQTHRQDHCRGADTYHYAGGLDRFCR
ncbi:MAG: DUF1566 domain-containing protein [Candidatus Magnetobacterium sp. LHC-1]